MRIIDSHTRAAIDTNATGIAASGVTVNARIIDSHTRAATAGDNATAAGTGAVATNAGVIDGHIAAGDANRAAAGTGIVGIKHGITDSHSSITSDPNCATGHTGISIATSTDVIICTCAFGTYTDGGRRTASIYSPLVFHFIRLIYSFMLSEFVWHRCVLYCACR